MMAAILNARRCTGRKPRYSAVLRRTPAPTVRAKYLRPLPARIGYFIAADLNDRFRRAATFTLPNWNDALWS